MLRTLSHCSLFQGMESEEVDRLLADTACLSRTYAQGEVIALQGSRYHQLMILIDGRAVAETTDRSQNTLRVEQITAPALIAPTYLFAEDNRLPVNITACSAVQIFCIGKEDLCTLLQRSRRVMTNFLKIVSTPNRFISEKVVYLTYKTIKGKFANFLLDKMAETGGSSFRNALTQREMADMFGVTRPALARAIGELIDEGAIYVKGKDVTVLFSEKLRQYAKN